MRGLSILTKNFSVNCPFRFIFVEFDRADDAALALVALHNHPFDAKHQFKVNRFTDIERYENLDEAYIEPEIEPYTPRVCSLTK